MIRLDLRKALFNIMQPAYGVALEETAGTFSNLVLGRGYMADVKLGKFVVTPINTEFGLMTSL